MALIMARRRHTPDQILKKLRDADVPLAEGLPPAEIAKRLEVSEQTWPDPKNESSQASVEPHQARRLND